MPRSNLLMFMAMVDFRDVRVIMDQRQMSVDVSVRFNRQHSLVMHMLMVVPVHVGVVVHQFPMRMCMAVMLPKEKKDARCHERSRKKLMRTPSFSQYGDGCHGAHEGRSRKVSRFTSGSKKSQRIDVQYETHPVTHRP